MIALLAVIAVVLALSNQPGRPSRAARASVPQPPRKTQRPGKLKFLNAPVIYTEGPGTPPAGFVNGNTSASEWYVYWALTKILGKPEEGQWSYQAKVLGGRKRPGGAVPDFVIYDRRPALILRVQTTQFHFKQGQQRFGYDEDQRRALERAGYQVIDLFEEQYIHDRSGRAVLRVVRDALAGQQQPNPQAVGTMIGR